ncbi:MAG: hypothetical protein QOJ40_122 [Verrucomicrobiota bacterium]
MTVGADGNFYGQASGGTYGWGIVFKMTPEGALTTFVSLNSDNGPSDFSRLVQSSDGNFYCVSQAGGPYGAGSVFKVSPTGVQTTIVSFTNLNAIAFGGLIEAADGNFYGPRSGGGAFNRGIIYRVTTEGVLTTMVSFNSTNGWWPRAALIQGRDGNFYGTTELGGAYDLGTAFCLHVPFSDSPKIRTATKSGTKMVLTWGALPGCTYEVQFKTNFNQTLWSDLGNSISATNTLATSCDSNASDSQRFYRIVLLR